MRIPISWIREFTPINHSAEVVADALIRLGFEVEGVETLGAGISGPLVVGRVLNIEELTDFKKPIRYCQVDVGTEHGGVRGIVCGARNFNEGDVVVAALPGSVLPGGFAIAARETYGRVSDGMLCSERELGLSQDHAGILILDNSNVPGADAAVALGLGDSILDISVNPDRGYAMSVRGIAREVAAEFGLPFTDPADALPELPPAPSDAQPRGIDVTASECSMFVLRTLNNIDVEAVTPAWMRNRLVAAGVRPVSLVVDVTNYVMIELGQPLHAFDADRVVGVVQVRNARSGEQLELIDHSLKNLDAHDVVIADDSGVLSLAGIMGGAGSEISESTRNVLIESAHFNAECIAASCRRNRISTDASRRFERGVDPTIAPVAAHRAASLLVGLAGAVSQGFVAVETARMPVHITTTAAEIGSVLGMSVTHDTCIVALKRVGCDVQVMGAVDAESDTRTSLHVTPPAWRLDVTLPCDLAEEVGRVLGYDAIPTAMPAVPASAGGLSPIQRARRVRDNRLVGLGWTQVMLSPFMSHAAVAALGCQPEDDRLNLVRLVNPMSDEEPFLRSTLLPSLATAVNRNRSRGVDSVALFESSAVHRDIDGRQPAPALGVGSPPSDSQFKDLLASSPQELRCVSGIAIGSWREASWDTAAVNWQWRHAIDAATSIVVSYGAKPHISRGERAGWHPGRCAEIRLGGPDGAVLGWAGELHPRAIEALSLPARAIAFEIYADALDGHYGTIQSAGFGAALPAAPVVKEDLAFIVNAEVPASGIAEALRAGCGEMLESVRLFDLYTGEQVGAGRKSLAFALKFRHPERSLTDDEVAQVREAGVAEAMRRYGATLRGA